MKPSTVYDRKAGAVTLGCATLASGIWGIAHSFNAGGSNLALVLIGSIVPFLLGLFCTVVAATSSDPDLVKLNMTWTGMSNLFVGVLAGFWVYCLGLSSLFAQAPSVGGIFSGLAVALTAWSMIRFP